MKNPKNILITGTSSGLGSALAQHYAAPGIFLHLSGRSEPRLLATAHACQAKGAQVSTRMVDVKEAAAMKAWIDSAHQQAPLDLVIANAGISAGTGGGGESAEQVHNIFATNIDGVLNTILPATTLMLKRGGGQIGIMSSLSGIRGLPSAPAYSASKAAVRVYGEGLRGYLKKYGIAVNVICPGYIKTPMTDVNDFPMPFLMTPEKAAKIIASGLAKNKSRIAFPLGLYWPLWLLSCLSPALTDPLFAALPAKPSQPHA